MQLEENMSPEAQDVLKKGNEFLVKIRESNDAIPWRRDLREDIQNGTDRSEDI